MKLVMPYGGEFDPAAMTFTLKGKTAEGAEAEMVLPILSPHAFLGWVAAVLREDASKRGSLDGTIVTRQIGMQALAQGANDLTLVFQFDVQGVEVSFALPLQNLEPSQRDAISTAFQQAITLVEKQVKRPRVN